MPTWRYTAVLVGCFYALKLKIPQRAQCFHTSRNRGFLRAVEKLNPTRLSFCMQMDNGPLEFEKMILPLILARYQSHYQLIKNTIIIKNALYAPLCCFLTPTRWCYWSALNYSSTCNCSNSNDMFTELPDPAQNHDNRILNMNNSF